MKMQRHHGLDFARAIAIVGMVLVNFDLAVGGGDSPALAKLLQGRASALFVILAGVGIGLLARSRGEHAPRVVVRRGLVLMAIGFAFLPLWPADILHFYGFWFVLAAPLLRVQPRALLGLAAAVVVAFPALLFAGLSYEKHWNFAQLEYTGQWTLDGLWRHLLFNGFHPTLPWFAFLLVGLALGPWLLAAASRTAHLVRALAFGAAAVATEALVRGQPDPPTDLSYLLDTSSMPPGPPYVVAAGCTALAVLSLSLALCHGGAGGPVVRFLAAGGRSALTLYIAHVVLGIVPAFVLAGYASPALSADGTLLLWASWCLVAFVLAWFWASKGRSGPAEALFRRLGS